MLTAFAARIGTVQRYMHEMAITAVFAGPNLSRRALRQRVSPHLLRNVEAAHTSHISGSDITYTRSRESWMYLVRDHRLVLTIRCQLRARRHLEMQSTLSAVDRAHRFSRYVISCEPDDTLEIASAVVGQGESAGFLGENAIRFRLRS